LIAALFFTTIVGLQSFTPVGADPDIQITDVQVPSEVAQAERGQVQATVHNLLDTSFDGYARFSDESGEIRSLSPVNPLSDTVNFTIGPDETIVVTVDYEVNESATIGLHIATFEISVGGFSFLFNQYPVTIVPVATITNVAPGAVFSQGQPGLLLVSIENRVDRTRSVRVEVFSPKFVNSTQDVELAPGNNQLAIPLMPNISHVYDFGMFLANVSIYYFDELISSEEVMVPVDMSLLNKVVAVILPAGIFLILVLFYAVRKRGRLRATPAESE
jgi:hypothetical protein